MTGQWRPCDVTGCPPHETDPMKGVLHFVRNMIDEQTIIILSAPVCAAVVFSRDIAYLETEKYRNYEKILQIITKLDIMI